MSNSLKDDYIFTQVESRARFRLERNRDCVLVCSLNLAKQSFVFTGENIDFFVDNWVPLNRRATRFFRRGRLEFGLPDSAEYKSTAEVNLVPVDGVLACDNLLKC